jgi:diguanylate cyclase (GGDEF)-like protein/PAS domain S-box-containing protein
MRTSTGTSSSRQAVAALVARARTLVAPGPVVAAVRERARHRRRGEARYRQIVETVKEGVVTIDTDNAISVVNQQAADMLGYDVHDVIARSRSQFSTADAGAGPDAGDAPPDGSPEQAEAGATGERETSLRRKDGTTVSVLLNESPLHDSDGHYTGQLGLITDLSERNGLQDELAFRSCHDPLTSLPNHLLLVDRLEAALVQAGSGGPGVAVVLVDVDGIKDVNAAYGHSGGDEVLLELARRLEEALPERDTVARSGGDEFVVVAEATGLLFVEGLVDRLREAMSERWSVGGSTVDITTSMGVAVGQFGDRPGTLLDGAHLALDAAHGRGPGRTGFFTDVLRAARRDRGEAVTDLRRALERHEFVLRFQPVVSLDDGRVVGAEALIRWEHPERGVVGPADFIPVAEESGLIDQIGEWVIEETSRYFAVWQRFVPELSMSLNVSARQFTADRLDDIVRKAIVATGMDPSRLAFEITEAVLMDDVEVSVRTLTSLREAGVKIAIDDFGTGYSSLSRLKRFPIDVLKIDQSFVAGLPDDAYDTALVQAVLDIGKALDLSVIAEGVENAAQAKTLRDLGCTRAQGFQFYRPLTPDQFQSALLHPVLA